MSLTLQNLLARRRKLRNKVPETSFRGITSMVPVVLGNEIICTARFSSLSDDDVSDYSTVINFTGLSVSMDKDNLHEIPVHISRGYSMYFARPSVSKTKVKVTCTCKDFYWTWWWAVNKGDSLAGAKFPPPSQITGRRTRVTDEKPYGSKPGRHPVTGQMGIKRNPGDDAGVCKHIVRLTEELLKKKYIVKWT